MDAFVFFLIYQEMNIKYSISKCFTKAKTLIWKHALKNIWK